MTKAETKPAPKVATPVKKRDVKIEEKEEKQASSARRMTDKTFKQKMAELQAEACGEKSTAKKELFGAKRPAEALSRTEEAKRAKK